MTKELNFRLGIEVFKSIPVPVNFDDMYVRRIVCLIVGCLCHFQAFCQVPVGNWREHLPYRQGLKVVANAGRVFCATPYSLFSVNRADKTIERFSKINGLSEVGINTIGMDEQSGKLMVAYTTSNIDILYKNQVINIDAIKRARVTGDKTVYDIFFYNNKAYLLTGLGIIVIDEDKYEVSDTYVISNNINNAKVNGFAEDGSFFYAAGPEGLKRANLNNSNLSDYRNWQLLSGNNGLPAGVCQQVLTLQNQLLAQVNDSLFSMKGNTWTFFYAAGARIVHVSASTNKLLLSLKRPGGESRVVVLNADGTISRNIEGNLIKDPQHGLMIQDQVWVADKSTGLISINANDFEQYQPGSPFSIAGGEMLVHNNTLWIAAGEVTASWNNTSNKNGLYQFENNQWSNYNAGNIPAFDSLPDIVTVAVDPIDHSTWAGSFGGGLMQFGTDRSVKIFKANSAIKPSVANPARYQVSGLAFDGENNLWVSNFGALQELAVRKADGNWRNFSIPSPPAEHAVAQVIIDDYNQKWIVSPRGNGLFCFNHGGSIDNTGDDRWSFYRAGAGKGNLPDNNVLSIASDKNGFIWVGTARGIGIIQCAQDVFSVKGCEAVLPVVQQDNFAGYLFRDEEVQSIAVDAADRKWIGTKNGVWLISPDAEKTIYHFREEDSPLLSNEVKKIVIDPVSGEVFFSTSKGICSFRGTATRGGSTNENVLVFPNPVPPGFNGLVAIRGLVNNAIVKITEPDGRLVYQTRAAGGQATWNGQDYKGRKVSSGVYLVVVSNDDRSEKTVGKIVFVR